MTDLKKKTAETIRKGEERRGDFTPKAGSIPVRLYKYWLDTSESVRAREVRSGKRDNFCHYWRVVVFWSWFGAVRRGAIKVAPYAAVAFILGILGFLIYTLLTSTVDWSELLLALLGGFGIFTGIFAVVFAGAFLVQWLNHKNFAWVKAIRNFHDGSGPFVLYPGLVITAICVGLAVFVSWTALFICLGILAVIGLGATGIAFLVERDEQKKDARQAEWDALSYEDQRDILLWLLAVREAKKTRKPSAVELKAASFLNNICDFAILLSQIVRVNKWKICPLVEIPEDKA